MPKGERKTSETIPSLADEVSAIGSASAPFIYSDWVGSHGIGVRGGVANITLEACRNMYVSGEIVSDRVVVAHLRMPIPALGSLKEAIVAIENLLLAARDLEKANLQH